MCASTFANGAKNATFILKYNNWMNGEISANVTAYNITHNIAVNAPSNMSGSIYDGCLLTELLPQKGTWTAGRNEISGTTYEIDGGGVATGTQEDLFAGPIEYLSGGSKNFG